MVVDEDGVALFEGATVKDVALTDGDSDIMLFASSGKAIRFHESDVRAMGRTARGVKGVTLGESESVIGAVVLHGGETLLSGAVVDQAALHGLLRRIRDLSLSLLSVTPVRPTGEEGSRP